MKAITLAKAGGTDLLHLQEVDQPEINADEVLVAVKAISINPADTKIRQEEAGLSSMYGDVRPLILGWDIAGEVVSVGKLVTDLQPGDPVFGMVNFPGAGNAYAEFVAAPATQLARKPDNVSFEAAAATTLAALTAWQVLNGRVKQGDRVLIHAGSGGVGHFAIQIAKDMGAYVISTSSARNREVVLELGADEHIDYRTQAFETILTDIDLVLDPMGGQVLINSLLVMRIGGTIVSLTTRNPTEEFLSMAAEKDVAHHSILVTSNGEDMKSLAKMLTAGTLVPRIDSSFPFTDMAAAHTAVESGRTVGKVVVTI